MIRAIIFDCFGVLTESRWTARVAHLDPEVRREVTDIHRAYERGFMEYTEYKDRIMELAGLSAQEADDMFIYRRGYQKNKDLLAYIAELSANYKVGILSNAGTSWVKDTFLTPAEAKLFDDMVLSFEVGLTKPDPEIYRMACDRLSLEPNEVVFVDDQVGYCQAAQQIGMQTVVYKDFVQFKHELQGLLADTNH